ncbi:MAG TPA: Kazal-type serine protease inhibitor domain-containing protein [Phycisphaerae bacterium]|nr:Kazal-type serine protease inhibitor domain-containing protein [Phycisphaerae bacterium]
MCLTEDGCGSTGACILKPDVCPAVFDPVCGCDGQTYGNACKAREAGANIEFDGPCAIECQDNVECTGFFAYCAKGIGECDGGGVCEATLQSCPQVYDPVCGCDGQTFFNICDAASQRINVAYLGECLPPSCVQNSDCDPHHFCSKPDSECGGDGVCVPTPQNCPSVFDPVCGCDGQTYSNHCVASESGQSVASDGACPEQCRNDTECDIDQFCLKEGCSDEFGACAENPQSCPLVFDPVCGCDGLTYDNACIALQAGANVDWDGPCVSNCTSNLDCSEVVAILCFRPIGDCDAPGVCRGGAPCNDALDPVCGCDGKTYRNACSATLADVGVQYSGPCAAACVSDTDCFGDEYCNRPSGECDEIGECTPPPGTCSHIYDPVCGCDGQTYGNSCYAAVAGVNVEYEGECCD